MGGRGLCMELAGRGLYMKVRGWWVGVEQRGLCMKVWGWCVGVGQWQFVRLSLGLAGWS